MRRGLQWCVHFKWRNGKEDVRMVAEMRVQSKRNRQTNKKRIGTVRRTMMRRTE